MVLMYHGIVSDSSPVPNNRETGAELYDISLQKFKSQINYLKEQGYTATTLENINSYNQKQILITFDDGEMNNFQQAYPILKEINWKACFFIIAKRVGEKGYMGWEELKKMVEAGMIIGSHGLTHEILTNLTDSQMEEELRASKSNLEINLGITVETLSIPRGFCNDKVIEKAYQLGYKTVFISNRPSHLKSSCFNRIAIKENWSLERFAAALKGKTPLKEMVGEFLIKCLKTIFRESGYNWIRNIIIRIIQ